MAESATESATDSSHGTSSGSESAQAVTLPEHLVGEIDEGVFTKLPDEARQTLSKLGKDLKGAYTKKLQDVADLRRVKEALDADPDKAKFLQRAIAEYDARKAGVLSDVRESSEAKTRLETLLEDVEPAQRKAVKEFIDGLDERYAHQLKQQGVELKELKEAITTLRSSDQLTRSGELKQAISALPGAFKALAQKHEDEILRLGTHASGSRASVQKLLQIVSDESEYRKAVLATGPEVSKSEAERVRETATARPSGAVSSIETLVEKGDIVKSRDKRFGDQLNLGSITQKVLKDLRRGS